VSNLYIHLESFLAAHDIADHSVVFHMQPLAVAANLFQASYCRLDRVLLGLERLYFAYLTLPDSEETVTTTMHVSLKRRWAATD